MRRLVVDASIAVKWLNPQETLADKRVVKGSGVFFNEGSEKARSPDLSFPREAMGI